MKAAERQLRIRQMLETRDFVDLETLCRELDASESSVRRDLDMLDAFEEHFRFALERLAPPSIIVDESYRVVHLSEHAGRYLQPSGGTLTNDVTELAREELRFDIRAALHRVFAHNEGSLHGPIGVR